VTDQPEPRSHAHKRIRSFVHRREGASRFAFTIDRDALKETAIVVIPVLLIILAAFWVASRYIRPAPPDTFVMSTGAPGGAYHLFAERYRDILAREGVTVELKPSAGSMDNLARLRDPASAVEVAFVQSGTAGPERDPTLQSLGSIYYEPLWIFHRGPELELINDLKGKRIAVGAEGSGTRVLAQQLLEAVGLTGSSVTLVATGGDAAADALAAGRIDAVFVVGAPDAPLVQRLIRTERVRLLSLANAEAFSRRYPHLSALTLPRGVIDLAAQIPHRDVSLLAATATLVIREDFHPALAYLMLHAAAEIHSGSGVLQKHREFPAARESEFVLSDQAQRYFQSGPPLLRRYLPFWLANLIERMLVLLVPLFAVLVPAFKVLPALIQWRVKSRVFRWYGEIRFLEDELARQPDRDGLRAVLERLDEIEQGVSRTSVPMSYADYAYNLRTHIGVVRSRVQRLQHPPATEAPIEEAATPAI
jgi:TRAP transporter TAXI family solute receptor